MFGGRLPGRAHRVALLGGVRLAPVPEHRAFHVGLERRVVDHQPAPASHTSCRRHAILDAPDSQFMAAHVRRDRGDAVEGDDLVED